VDEGNVPNRGGVLLLEYRPEGQELGGSLSLHGVGSYKTDQFAQQQGLAPLMPGYGLLDINLTKKLRQGIRMTLTVNNLLDQRHQENGPMIFLPPPGIGAATVFGRTTWVSLERSF
jgi:outer membrane receptor protein involved in Fe transport